MPHPWSFRIRETRSKPRSRRKRGYIPGPGRRGPGGGGTPPPPGFDWGKGEGVKSEGHHQGPSLEGKGGHQGLVPAVLREGPVHDEGEGAVFGETTGEEGEEGFGEGPGVLQGGVMEEAPEAIEAALGQGGEGVLRARSERVGSRGAARRVERKRARLERMVFLREAKALWTQRVITWERGWWAAHLTYPLFSSLVKPQPSK